MAQSPPTSCGRFEEVALTEARIALDNETRNQSVCIQISSDPAHLPRIREAIQQVAMNIGFSEEQIGKMTLAVDEAIANVIKHGYCGCNDQPIEVLINPVERDGHQGIKLVIRDFGKQVSPESICGRDLDDVKPGGLGVHIIRSIMDEVIYSKADGGGMQLELMKLNKP